MKFFSLIGVLLLNFFIFSAAYGQSNNSMKIIKHKIEKVFSNEKGDFAVAFKDISTGKQLLINEQEEFHAASTMKTPVMIEVFKQAKEGKFSLKDSFLIKNQFKSIVDSSFYSLDSIDDSESEIYRHIGEKRTLYDLMYEMIVASSNLSTNLVIDLVNAKKVTQTMRELGAKKIKVLRGVEDNKAYELGLNNTTTAYDLMVIYEKIAEGKAVDKKSSDEMIYILSQQEHNDIIPAELPKNVKVAHKTGWITGVHHDSGIVILPDGRKYVLVLLSKNLEDDSAAVKAMAYVSRLVYDYENP
ncbi:MAG: serine hydrolase [Bacteroidota bacterium]|nr:serine hydrolase [Bacteroidota bacterium]